MKNSNSVQTIKIELVYFRNNGKKKKLRGDIKSIAILETI